MRNALFCFVILPVYIVGALVVSWHVANAAVAGYCYLSKQPYHAELRFAFDVTPPR